MPLKRTRNHKVKTSVFLIVLDKKGSKIYESFSFDNPCDEIKLVPVL